MFLSLCNSKWLSEVQSSINKVKTGGGGGEQKKSALTFAVKAVIVIDNWILKKEQETFPMICPLGNGIFLSKAAFSKFSRSEPW